MTAPSIRTAPVIGPPPDPSPKCSCTDGKCEDCAGELLAELYAVQAVLNCAYYDRDPHMLDLKEGGTAAWLADALLPPWRPRHH